MMKKIPLSRGKCALVDDADHVQLAEMTWHINASGYAAHSEYIAPGQVHTVIMHRLIMDARTGDIVDHRNGDKLDNRRSNLRFVDDSQSARNRGLRSDNTSGYKGVYWHTHSKLWTARITVRGQRLSLGYYKYPLDAARAYNDAARQYHGEYARLNMLDEIDMHVRWNRENLKWEATIAVDDEPMHLGYFTSRFEAIRTYKEAAEERDKKPKPRGAK